MAPGSTLTIEREILELILFFLYISERTHSKEMKIANDTELGAGELYRGAARRVSDGMLQADTCSLEATLTSGEQREARLRQRGGKSACLSLARSRKEPGVCK